LQDPFEKRLLQSHKFNQQRKTASLPSFTANGRSQPVDALFVRSDRIHAVYHMKNPMNRVTTNVARTIALTT
jgi:hypothetical protein